MAHFSLPRKCLFHPSIVYASQVFNLRCPVKWKWWEISFFASKFFVFHNSCLKILHKLLIKIRGKSTEYYLKCPHLNLPSSQNRPTPRDTVASSSRSRHWRMVLRVFTWSVKCKDEKKLTFSAVVLLSRYCEKLCSKAVLHLLSEGPLLSVQ